MKTILRISLLLIILPIMASCEKDKDSNSSNEFTFPELNNIDPQVYNEIQSTCELYWDLSTMLDHTFWIDKEGDDYVINCYGKSDGQLYRYVIRTDKDGKWINNGRQKIPVIINLSKEYRDITDMFSVNDFENTKDFILENGDRQTYCSMYGYNPHYAFSYFDVYLNPEIGQVNIFCNPETSDFNMIVISDFDSEPQYYYLLIIRQGDLAKAEVPDSITDLKEESIYLTNPFDGYNLDSLEADVSVYIDIMKNR